MKGEIDNYILAGAMLQTGAEHLVSSGPSIRYPTQALTDYHGKKHAAQKAARRKAQLEGEGACFWLPVVGSNHRQQRDVAERDTDDFFQG